MNYKWFEKYKVYENGDIYSGDHKMSSSDNGRGYQVIRLTLKEGRKIFGVHRLVALCFIPNPENYPEVNHKDGNKLNNHFTNLEWVNRGQNIKHAFENELRSATGINNARCLTNEKTVHKICKLLQEGLSSATIRDLGFDYSLVRSIKSRRNWKHISKQYSF